jgi:hypothetical protein
MLLTAPALVGQTLVNGGFEDVDGATAKGWHAYGTYAVDAAVARSGARAIRCETAEADKGSGAMQEIVYEHPDRSPVLFGGWSRSDGVSASDYCIYLDVWYEGGGNAWGVTAEWSQPAHDWEYAAQVFYPEKPVKKIQCFVFLRRGKGRVWFDDLSLERRAPSLGVRSVRFASDYPRTQAGVHAAIGLWKSASWRCGFLDAAGKETESFSGKGIQVSVAAEGVGTPVSVRVSATAGAETSEQTYAVPVFRPPRNPVGSGCAVWTADSMRRVTPLTYPSEAELKRVPQVRLDVARNESESAQILVTASADGPVKDVEVALTPFMNADGEPLDGDAGWMREGYVRRARPFNSHPSAVPVQEEWIPDPLLPPRPFDVRAGATQGIWLTVRAGERAKPGLYRGQAILSTQSAGTRKIPVTVRVLELCNPQTFGFPTAFCVMDGFIRAQYPGRFEEMKRKAHDLMLNHRLNPDDISRTEPPLIDDLLYARKKGMNRFNILNLVPKPKKPGKWVCYAPVSAYTPAFYEELKARLTPYVTELRKHGLQTCAYLYGFDERTHDFYPAIDTLCKKLKADFPDIPVMTTAMMFRDMKDGHSYPCQDTTDWFCPLTSVYEPDLAAKLRAQGRQVWWYVCCGPTYPYANFASLEYPFVEGRLLGWMAYRYRADGLLYWHVNLWPDAPPLKTDDAFLTAWQAENSLRMPGDGQLLYPGEDGPLPSIRLANIRDGIEDYEWLVLLERQKGRAVAEKETGGLIRSMTDFDRTSETLLSVRSRVAEALCPRPVDGR